MKVCLSHALLNDIYIFVACQSKEEKEKDRYHVVWFIYLFTFIFEVDDM